MATVLTPRQMALRAGEKTYSGRLCYRCDGTVRSVRSGDCVACVRVKVDAMRSRFGRRPAQRSQFRDPKAIADALRGLAGLIDPSGITDPHDAQRRIVALHRLLAS